MAAALVSSLAGSSCLLGRGVVFEGDGGPTLTPPLILEQETRDEAGRLIPGGSLIGRDTTETNSQVEVGFVFQVIEPNPDESVYVRFFVDRPLACQGIACRHWDREEPYLASPDRPRSGTLIDVSVRLPFIRAATPSGDQCHRIDVYVSSRFRDTDQYATRPVRDGDVAHAFWYVIVLQPGLVRTNDPCGLN